MVDIIEPVLRKMRIGFFYGKNESVCVKPNVFFV